MSRTSALNPTGLAIAVGAGTLLMYLLDPQQGRRRAALARDKVVHLAYKGSDFAQVSLRDLSHRTTGLLARMRRAAQSARADDPVLVDRVRATLGRWVAHPHAIKVTANTGQVTLTGPVLLNEHEQLLRAVCGVRGVRGLDDRLEVHLSTEGIPALQGGRERPGPRGELMQQNWAPGPRLAMVAVGGALAWYGLGRRDVGGTLIGLVAGALALQAATHKNMRATLAAEGARHAGASHEKAAPVKTTSPPATRAAAPAWP